MLETDKFPAPNSTEAMRGDPSGDHVVFTRTGFHCNFCGNSHHIIDSEEVAMFDLMVDAKAFYVEHRRCKPPKDDKPAPFARMKTRQEFNHAVNYHSDPQGLTELHKQIGAYRKLADDVVQRHPLFDAQNEGFRNLYGQLNRRAEALGFKKYNSGGYYAPLYMIEDKRLTPDDVGRWLIFMALQSDRNSKLTKRVKLISWDETGALVEFLNAEKRIDFDQLVWYRDEE